MSIYGRGLARAYARGRAAIREMNISVAIPNQIRRDVCLCGLPKKSNHLTCLLCWKATPYQDRLGLKSHDITVRRSAARKLLTVARERGGTGVSPVDSRVSRESVEQRDSVQGVNDQTAQRTDFGGTPIIDSRDDCSTISKAHRSPDAQIPALFRDAATSLPNEK